MLLVASLNLVRHNHCIQNGVSRVHIPQQENSKNCPSLGLGRGDKLDISFKTIIIKTWTGLFDHSTKKAQCLVQLVPENHIVYQ